MSKKSKKHHKKAKSDISTYANSESLKGCSLYVEGMHCASCEILIEKKMLKKDGIKSVEASTRSGEIKLKYENGDAVNVDELNKEFKDMGYTFSTKKPQKENTKLFNVNLNGQLEINSKKLMSSLKMLGVVLVVFAVFVIFEQLHLGRYVSVQENSSIGAFFLLGVVAGVSSCAALVGGLLLSMVKQWNELYIDEDKFVQKAQPHFLFHAGRLISFAVLGGVLGAVGGGINVNNLTVYSVLTILISAVMLILALQMLEVGWAQKIKFGLPKSLTGGIADLPDLEADEKNIKGRLMPAVLGALTFFLPCGFTLIAQGVALTSGSFLEGAAIMFLFALGTFPALFAISMGGVGLNSRPHLTAKFNFVAGIVVIFFVLYNINGQLNVLGLTSLNDIKLSSGETSVEVVEVKNGRQTLNFIATGFEYDPQGPTTIKAGIPTTIIFDNQGIQGCGAYAAARGLIPNYVALEPGINTIDIGKPKKGTYKLTCSMGMVPPVTIKVI